MTTRRNREQEASEMETSDSGDTRNTPEVGIDKGTTAASGAATANADAMPVTGATNTSAPPEASPDKASSRRAGPARKPRTRRKSFVL